MNSEKGIKLAIAAVIREHHTQADKAIPKLLEETIEALKDRIFLWIKTIF